MWPHALHMGPFRVRCTVLSTDHLEKVYKVDYFVKSFLLSSLVSSLIQEFDLLSHSKD